MKISAIIPTHNRSASLRQTIESLVLLACEAPLEIVVVDNNSTDDTRQVAQSFGPMVRYVFEERTAFTRARSTGAENATGEILLYLDDDVLLFPGSLRRIVEIFRQHPDCGVIAGRIEARFLEQPPAWTLACQKSFNGWSLFNSETYSIIGGSFQEVPSACGPMMAIGRSAYQKAGGFPPDTIGVETNTGARAFRKLYIGPGDYGLCLRVREAGFKVYYTPEVGVYHVIPPIRLSVEFWRSRMIGEGHYVAIADRGFFALGPAQLLLKRHKAQFQLFQAQQRFKRKVTSCGAPPMLEGMLPEELWMRYHAAWLEMDAVLRLHPKLCYFLWDIGANGVPDNNFERVMNHLPQEYKNLVASDQVYDNRPMDSTNACQLWLAELSPQVRQENRQAEAFIDQFYRLFRLDPRDIEALSLFLDGARTDAASNCLQRVRNIESSNAHLLKWLGAMQFEAGQADSARESFERAAALLPEDQEVRHLLRQLDISNSLRPAAENPAAPPALQTLFEESASLLKERKFSAALKKLDEAKLVSPIAPRLNLLRARCYEGLNRKRQAVHAALDELALSPGNAEAVGAVCRNLAIGPEEIKGNPDGTLALLNRVRQAATQPIGGVEQARALCLLALAKPEGAVTALETELAANPSNAEARAVLEKTRLALEYEAQNRKSSNQTFQTKPVQRAPLWDATAREINRQGVSFATNPISRPSPGSLSTPTLQTGLRAAGLEALAVTPSSKAELVQIWMHYRNLAAQRLPLPKVSETGFRVYSQTDEDGIVLFLFAVAGAASRVIVEIGTGNATECNGANLAINFGWHGLFVDGNAAAIVDGRQLYSRHPDTRVYPPVFVASTVTAENTNEVVGKAGFQGEIDLLSIGIHGMDYWVWKAIDCVKPRVVVVEANAALGGERSLVVPYRPDFTIPAGHPYYHGAALPALVKLAHEKGYRLVGTNRFGSNAFFVRNDCVPDLIPAVEVASCRRHPCCAGDPAVQASLSSLPFVVV